MANYKLNTTGPFAQRDGSAITSSSTKIDGGSFKSQYTESDLLRESVLNGVDNYPTLQGNKNVSFADQNLIDSGASGVYVPRNTNGLFGFNKQSGTLSGTYNVNDFVKAVGNSGAFVTTARVVSSTTSGIVLNIPYSVTYSGDVRNYGVSLYKVKNYFGKLTKENYSIKNAPNKTHNVDNAGYRSADINTRDAVHSLQSLRTTRVTSAIRAGYWNPYTATFSVPVSGTNDYGDEMTPKGTDSTPDDLLNKDSSNRALAAKVTLRTGAANPISTSYPAKT